MAPDSPGPRGCHLKKSSAFAAVALTLAAAPAFAADMPVKARVAAVAAAYNWTGWYIGGNVGYGWGNDTGDRWDSFVDPGFVQFGPYLDVGNALPGVRPSGVTGGAQVGYNWQATAWVFGVVADIQASDMRASASNFVDPGFGFSRTIQSNDARIDWFGTVRGRVGYAANNWLFYGTGGIAYGNVKSTVAFNCLDCFPSTIWTGSTSSTRVGWAAGAGIEVGLTPNWTAGVEYLHIDLGSISTTALPNTAPFVGSSISASSKFAGDIVRATVNYKFAPAVVAKY